MSKKSELENRVKVKAALADKYLRLARARKSKPWKVKLYRQAEAYHQQSLMLSQGLNV